MIESMVIPRGTIWYLVFIARVFTASGSAAAREYNVDLKRMVGCDSNEGFVVQQYPPLHRRFVLLVLLRCDTQNELFEWANETGYGQ